MVRKIGDQIEQLARQASLAIVKDEQEQLVSQLSCMLEMLEPILELDSSGAEPTSCGVFHSVVCREDEVAPSLSLEQVFQNASSRDGDYFKVPQIASLEG
ncbi:MAG TPA: Asp-tRNA(Asn)/Glu-tRNA(Gln) amidotransferase subunit GatC [Firmicutes bacterium]|nr:Asp-tRNA(Asn)/Glu-tRNA(Gln) amidotransferase subunit GatC [Bacillota bacterium]